MWTPRSLPSRPLYFLASQRTSAAAASYTARPVAALALATTFDDDKLVDGSLSNVIQQAYVA